MHTGICVGPAKCSENVWPPVVSWRHQINLGADRGSTDWINVDQALKCSTSRWQKQLHSRAFQSIWFSLFRNSLNSNTAKSDHLSWCGLSALIRINTMRIIDNHTSDQIISLFLSLFCVDKSVRCIFYVWIECQTSIR